MFHIDNQVVILRNHDLPLSPFALQHLQCVKAAGHLKANTFTQTYHPVETNDTYLLLYSLNGTLEVSSLNFQSIIIGGNGVLLYCDGEITITFSQCELYYAQIQGKDIFEFIKHRNLNFDFRFKKKMELFFHSVFSCLDKYSFLDEFSLSSAVLRLYSDIYIYHHEIKNILNKQEVVEKALQYIEENYQNDIQLKDISNAVGYSEFYFLRIFKEIVKMTPYDFLIRRRLTQSKILMLSSDMKIADIAWKSGFKNDISFYNSFKKVYSITPNEYRKAMKQ